MTRERASTSNDADEVKEALLLIERARLPHPSGPLLSPFVVEALNPQLAAEYILRICRHSHDQQADLRSLVSDWSYVVESSTVRLPPCLALPHPWLMTDSKFQSTHVFHQSPTPPPKLPSRTVMVASAALLAKSAIFGIRSLLFPFFQSPPTGPKMKCVHPSKRTLA